MALPIGHGLIGLAIAKKTKVNPIAAFLLANLPDIDFFFGLFWAGGNMLALHRDPITHSPLFATIMAVLFWSWGILRKKPYEAIQILGVFFIVLSHWAIDYYMPRLPYIFDFSLGKNGLGDFFSTHILTPLFSYNNIVDLAIYGTIYIIVVKLIFREKRLF